jgi:hypothetical protein
MGKTHQQIKNKWFPRYKEAKLERAVVDKLVAEYLEKGGEIKRGESKD